MKSPLVVLLALLCSGAAMCQLPQLHPELCATPNGVISLPRDFSAVVDQDNVLVKFFFKSGATTINVQAFLDQIAEVCPLSDGRIVVFGGDSAGLPGATSIYIIDEAAPALLDNIGGYQPIISPDQRWIVYRKEYSPHDSEPVSEEYLLYDLSKSAAQNRAAGITANDTTNVGGTIFPLGQNNVPLDNTGVPEYQQHSAASALFWSPDSKVVVFADGLLGKVSLVLVTIGSSGATGAFVYPIVGISPKCGSYRPVSHVEFGPEQGADRVLLIDFASDCASQRLQIHRSDFQPAKPEVHEPRKYPNKTIKGEPQ